MVIDELAVANALEIHASLLCKQRGVRLIAAAGGNLRKLVQETMSAMSNERSNASAPPGFWSDNAATNTAQLQSRLVGGPSPIFDAVVELQSCNHQEWRVILNVATASQQILYGNTVIAQRRSMELDTGAILLDLVRL